jgi:transaldolase
MAMKFFVDTAETAETKLLAATGLLDGATTYSSLLAKSGKRMAEVNHPLIEKGLAGFLADWTKTGLHIA